MSTEFHLPAELSELERRLNRVPLPDSALDRDALLYQAGWAAAEGHFSRRNGRWLWPAATVAMAAASLFFWVTAAVVKNPPNQIALAPSPTTNAPRSMPPPSPTPPRPKTTRLAHNPLNHKYMIGRGSAGMSLLSMHSEMQYQQPLAEIGPSIPSKTSRELLQELLPEFTRPAQKKTSVEQPWWRAFS